MHTAPVSDLRYTKEKQVCPDISSAQTCFFFHMKLHPQSLSLSFIVNLTQCFR